MTAGRAAAVALLVLLTALPVHAESPSPTPDDRTTSLTVSPAAGPARSTVTLRGYSDCAVIDGHLLFTTYDGKPDNVVVRATTSTYDYDREKYPFVIRIRVPLTAAPGEASVYAQPFCAPPEEYPTSDELPFRVERSALAVQVSPRRPESGQRVGLRASTCAGPTGRLSFRVQVGGDVREVSAPVDALGSASASVRLGSATGDAQVTLPRAADECRGSVPPRGLTFRVRPGRTSVTPGESASASASPGSSPSSSAQPSPTSSGPASPSAAAEPSRRVARGAGGLGLAALVAAVLLAAAAAAGAVAVRRRRA